MSYQACYLQAILLDEEAESQTVVLEERSGGRRLPIAIGTVEAQAIDRAVRSQIFPRPLTHDLLTVLIEALKAELIEIRITDLRNGTFYAALVLRRADGSLAEVDCRPSDAIGLLVRRSGTPLSVARTVLDEAAA